MILMCTCMFNISNKCTIPISDVDNRGGDACVGQGFYEKNLYHLNFIENLNYSKN